MTTMVTTMLPRDGTARRQEKDREEKVDGQKEVQQGGGGQGGPGGGGFEDSCQVWRPQA